MYSRVYVEITNICNMNCSFCHGHSRRARRMTPGEFSHILDQLAGQTEYIYYHLMGEPLTHPDLPLFLKMAEEKGFRSVITTNGTLLDQRKEAILSAKPHKVSISLHSFESDDSERFARYLSDASDFAESAAARGIIVVFRLWNKGHDGGMNRKTEAFLRERLPGEWAENSRGFRIRRKLFLEWGDRFLWPDIDGEEFSHRAFCYGLQDHFGILCDGSVVPCCMDSDGVISLGNIFETDLREILSSPRAKAIIDGFSEKNAVEELCRKCGYAQRFL